MAHVSHASKNKKFFFLGVVLFFYGLLVVPLLVLNSQSKQETRSHAQATCGNAPTDTVIIIDRSGSMAPSNKLPPTKTAANKFIDVIAQSEQNRVSVVSFSTTATLLKPLTTDFAGAKASVNSISAEGWTCVECAIKAANQEIAAHGRAGVKKVIVLLTDGQANYIEGSSQQVSTTLADQRALAAAQSGYNASKTQFFTIGLGDPNASGNERFFNPTLLQNIATTTGGKFYFPLPAELNNVYNDISLLIGKATVGGFVFNDANGNGTYDSGEAKVPGWTLTLVSPTWGTKTTTTDSTGNYLFTSICDGTYSLKLTPQTGWTQSFPADPNGHAITIKNGFSVLDKNFGVKKFMPTATPIPTATPKPTSTPSPTPGVTTLSLTVFLDGIGNRGDNTNPIESSLSNKDPLHPVVETDVQIYNGTNLLVASGAGVVKYSSASGNFKGELSISSIKLTQGSAPYTVKVKARRYLRKQVAGIQTITTGKTNDVTPVSLVAGDINNDNKIDIRDYNLLIDCYSDLAGPLNCASSEKKTVADINDDGFVNQVDYNLFLREIATQPGN